MIKDKTDTNWVLDEAIDVVRLLQADCMGRGYYIAIAGGVLNKGYSNNDLDLVAVPRTVYACKQTLIDFLGTHLDIREGSSLGGVTEVLAMSYKDKPLDIAIVSTAKEKILLPDELPEEIAEEESDAIDHVCDTRIYNGECDDFVGDDLYKYCPLITGD